MSTERDDGGPAFPYLTASECGHEVTTHEGEHGMSLRDYFAAKAMHQILHGAVLPDGYDASAELAMLGSRAYEVADAMLKARQS